MNRNINISASSVFFFLVSFWIISCNSELEEEIYWQLGDHPDMLVVEGMITNRLEEQIIYLSVTAPYLSNQPPEAISHAVITVSDGEHTYNYTERGKNTGVYLSDTVFRGIPFSTYTLSITLSSPLNDLTNYSATAVMPEGLELDTIICEIYPMPDFGFGGGEEDPDTTLLGIYYYGKEPDDSENYYLSAISGNSFPWEKNAGDLIRFTDDQNNGGESDFILFIQNVAEGDTITFEISSVDRSYYEFTGSIQQMEDAGSAYSMSGPPANATGNIRGALGYFHAAFISKKQGIARKN